MATTISISGGRILRDNSLEVQFSDNTSIVFPGGTAQLLDELSNFVQPVTLKKILIAIIQAKGLTPAQAIGHSMTYDPSQAANVLVFG